MSEHSVFPDIRTCVLSCGICPGRGFALVQELLVSCLWSSIYV